MILDMIRKWEEGYPVVICVKVTSGESGLMFWIRKQYYRLVKRLSEWKPTRITLASACMTARW